MVLVGAAVAVSSLAPSRLGAQPAERVVKKGRLKQSVSRWCYKDIPDPAFYKAVADMGLPAVDLLKEDQWSAVRDYGLICSMGYGDGGTIPDGLNVSQTTTPSSGRPRPCPAVKLGVLNLITFFATAARNPTPTPPRMHAGLNRSKGPAEDAGVTVCVELLNSKVNHPVTREPWASSPRDREAVGSPA